MSGSNAPVITDDVAEDKIEKCDRSEFIAATDVLEKKQIRNLRFLTGYSSVFFAAWLILTGIFHVNIPFLIVISANIVGLEIMLKGFFDPKQLRCPNCAHSLLFIMDWQKNGSSPWPPKSLRYLLASGRCSYCRKEIFQTPATLHPTLSRSDLQGGKGVASFREIFFIILAAGMTIMTFTTLFATEVEASPSLLFINQGVAFVELVFSVWLWVNSFKRTNARPILCPVCNGDLSRDNLRAIARETGGCGLCGAKIIADFSETIEPDRSDTIRMNLLKSRRKEGKYIMILGLFFLLATLSTILGVWIQACRLPEIGKRATATVLVVNESKKSFSFTYLFDTESGKTQIFQRSGGRGKFSPGQKYPVIYWRQIPAFHTLNGWRSEVFLITTVYSGLFAVMGLACVLLGLWVMRGNEVVSTGDRFIRLKPGEILADHFPDDAACAKLRNIPHQISLMEVNKSSPRLKYGWLFCLLLCCGGTFAGVKLLSAGRLIGQDDVKIYNILFYGGIVSFVFAGAMLIYAIVEIYRMRKSDDRG